MQISGLPASGAFTSTDVLAIDVEENGVKKTYKLTGATLAAALAGIGNYLTTGDVVNNLTSTATDKPLSAAQGKDLNEKKVGIGPNTSSVVAQQSITPSFQLQIWSHGNVGDYVISFGSNGIYLYDINTQSDIWHISP